MLSVLISLMDAVAASCLLVLCLCGVRVRRRACVRVAAAAGGGGLSLLHTSHRDTVFPPHCRSTAGGSHAKGGQVPVLQAYKHPSSSASSPHLPSFLLNGGGLPCLTTPESVQGSGDAVWGTCYGSLHTRLPLDSVRKRGASDERW